MNVEKIIKANKGTILDVRTSREFSGGSVAGSINIPLMEIPERIDELKSMKAPLVYVVLPDPAVDMHIASWSSMELNVVTQVPG